MEWDLGPNAGLTQAQIVAGHEAAAAGPGIAARVAGDAEKAIAGAPVKVEAVYQLPFLAHAPMEPMNCTVHVRPDGADVWCGTQVPPRAQAAAAKAAGLPIEKVTLHGQMVGGGFGRRLEADYVSVATALARQVPYPLKVIWTRQTDIQHDRYRPYYYDKLAAGLDGQGKIVGWTHKVTSGSVTARWGPSGMEENGLDPDCVDGARDLLYEIPNLHVSWVRHDPPGLITGWWRGVGPAHNSFVVESFIDELAHAAKADPVAFRRERLGKTPRALGVLDLAARSSDWGAALPPGVGRGVMVQFAFGSYLAVVAEVEAKDGGPVRIRRLVAAMDCGQVINPDSVRAQIQGGLIFGASAALFGQVTLDKGVVQQSNFDSYRILRLAETPAIDIHLVDSTESPGGLGETACAAVFPALANAVFAATGRRRRRLPLNASEA
jgi:isoquinoline 1-oxidoreductase subunit beta